MRCKHPSERNSVHTLFYRQLVLFVWNRVWAIAFEWPWASSCKHRLLPFLLVELIVPSFLSALTILRSLRVFAVSFRLRLGVLLHSSQRLCDRVCGQIVLLYRVRVAHANCQPFLEFRPQIDTPTWVCHKGLFPLLE